MDNYSKYLKYKSKYLLLKAQKGGDNLSAFNTAIAAIAGAISHTQYLPNISPRSETINTINRTDILGKEVLHNTYTKPELLSHDIIRTEPTEETKSEILGFLTRCLRCNKIPDDKILKLLTGDKKTIIKLYQSVVTAIINKKMEELICNYYDMLLSEDTKKYLNIRKKILNTLLSENADDYEPTLVVIKQLLGIFICNDDTKAIMGALDDDEKKYIYNSVLMECKKNKTVKSVTMDNIYEKIITMYLKYHNLLVINKYNLQDHRMRIRKIVEDQKFSFE